MPGYELVPLGAFIILCFLNEDRITDTDIRTVMAIENLRSVTDAEHDLFRQRIRTEITLRRKVVAFGHSVRAPLPSTPYFDTDGTEKVIESRDRGPRGNEWWGPWCFLFCFRK